MLERMLRTSTSCMQPCFTLLLCGKHACIVYDTWNEMRHTHAIFSSMLVALSLHSRTHPCSLTSMHKFMKQATYRSCSHKEREPAAQQHFRGHCANDSAAPVVKSCPCHELQSKRKHIHEFHATCTKPSPENRTCAHTHTHAQPAFFK